MRLAHSFRGLMTTLVVAVLLLAAGIGGAPRAFAAAADGTYSQTGVGYVPLTPSRLLDTRSGVGAVKARVSAGGSVTIQVTGRGGVPASGVSAVAVNATAVAPSAAGYVTVFPAGVTRPVASSLNYAAGATVANQVLAKLGSGGRLTMYSHASVDLLLDVAGYYPSAAVFAPLQPVRVLDTRSGLGAAKAQVGAGKSVDLQVLGRGGIPPSGVGAVVLNVTAVGTAGAGYVTVFPAGQDRPTTSNLNYLAGGTVPALVVVPPGVSGKVTLFTHANADLVADVLAYIPAGSDYSALTAPSRLVDTRSGLGAAKARVPAGGSVMVTVAGAGGVPADAVSAAFLNVTAVNPTRAGYLSVYPAGTARPTASVVNYTSGVTRANSILARLGTAGQVTIYSNAATDLVVDVAGYAATPLTITMTQPATTTVVPATTTTAVTAPTALGGTGSVTTSAAVPAPGGYLYLPPGGANGDGVLGKVTSATSSGGSTTAAIVAVPLEEAFPAGHIAGTTTSTDPLLLGASAGPTTKPRATTGRSAAGKITPKCDDSGATAEVSLNATVEVRVTVLADWGFGKRAHLRVTSTAGITVDGSVNLSAAVTCTWSSTPLQLGIIGPFTVSQTWDTKISVTGAIKTGVTWTNTTTDGFDWWSGENPTRVHSQTKNVTWTPPDAATAAVRFSAGPTVHLDLFGQFGPEIGVAAYVEVKADTAANPWWTVSFGIEAKAGIKIDVLFLVHAEYTLPVATVFSAQVGRAPGAYPGYVPLAVSTTSLPPGTVGQPYTAQLTAVGGTNPYTWTATGLPPGLALNNGTISGSTTIGGVNTITVTVIDVGGARASKTLTMAVSGGTSPTSIRQLEASHVYTCALLVSGAVKCWGYLGNSWWGIDTVNSLEPATIIEGGVESISLGWGHACAVTTGGAAKCWGDNYNGELGNGDTSEPPVSSAPVQVQGLTSGVKAVAAGMSHSCALLTTGTVRCWGNNWSGQLGDGTTTNSLTPVDVTGLSAVESLKADDNGDSTCVVLTTGRVKCWGNNGVGQLGNGSTTNSSVPVDVVGLTDGASVDPGNGYACAVLTSGSVKCWGWGPDGRLGNGTQGGSPTPVLVLNLSDATSVVASDGSTCATTRSGILKCWGDNTAYILGDESIRNSAVPLTRPGLAGSAQSVALGTSHACALLADGKVQCWGWNTKGQLGDGTTMTRQSPVSVAGLG